MIRKSVSKSMIALVGVAVIGLSLNAEARRYRRHHSVDPINVCQMVPPNTQAFSIDPMDGGSITEPVFNAILNSVQTVYAPIFASKGAALFIDRLWTNDEANAYADRPNKTTWAIHMFGGLARHPSMTVDSMFLVACHEIGHHLGGAPKYTLGWKASAEGEADYFAVLKCMRRVFAQYNNVAIVNGVDRTEMTPEIVQRCRTVSQDPQAVATCIRTIIAGQHLALALTDIENNEAAQASKPAIPTPNIDTPDRSATPVTLFNQYPALQCRLDTYVAGSVCPANAGQDMDDRDPSVGACMLPVPGIMPGTNGIFFAPGARPACWFRQ